MILLELFLTFLKIGIFTFGGGYSMVALIQNEVVEKNGWTGVTCPAYLQNAILKRDLPLCVKAVITCCDQVGMDEIEELSNHLMNQIAKVACGFVARDARFLIG